MTHKRNRHEGCCFKKISHSKKKKEKKKGKTNAQKLIRKDSREMKSEG